MKKKNNLLIFCQIILKLYFKELKKIQTLQKLFNQKRIINYFAKLRNQKRQNKQISYKNIMKINNIILLIIFLSYVKLCFTEKIAQQQQSNNKNLLVQLEYSIFQGFIKIEFKLLNDSFAENYNIKLIEVQINSNNFDENRYFSDLQQTTIWIEIQLKDAFKDMVIKVVAKQSQVQTRTNKQMSGDFYQEINFGTQLPQLVSLDLSKNINQMQNSSWMDFFRIFPLYLIFFNSLQGVFVIIVAEIKLPQRLYEVIRLLSCFYFKNLRGWTVSQDYPYDIAQSSTIGVDIYSSDSNIYLSLIGISENIFAQAFWNIVILIIFWLLYYMFLRKKQLKFALLVGNIISFYHKITLLLFFLVFFSQLRLAYTLQSSGQSITSFIIGVLMLIYMIYLILFVSRKLLKDHESSEDQESNQKSLQEIVDLLYCYFLSQNQKDYLKHIECKQLSQKINSFFPLISFYFKIYISFILVFMQGTKQGQISLILEILRLQKLYLKYHSFFCQFLLQQIIQQLIIQLTSSHKIKVNQLQTKQYKLQTDQKQFNLSSCSYSSFQNLQLNYFN
ncbi:transmembrane protein, putative (macronuclear) [Tetrahymena thermophila SB210]|uniref:Transmembrane protein, putative n=1 Tax=Tetrahymena thermophila (strain SB210) TaxID=312017 RepID=W7XFN5_TETTS|nr:transmembrane protein, putative [Tetrahymena thermophila SB210]EWS72821.1 transmembrane protein, putative [Tetrahymena thermophila SB210]|eukprot:XP_012654647.1 transmembrane protein, putative [Tetrahymena thermophila SB210]